MAILEKIHYKNIGFTQINNCIITDNRLSSTAKIVLITILSMKNGWNVNIDILQKSMSEGRQAIGNALKQLESVGYINRYRIYENGKIKDWIYRVKDYVEVEKKP